MKLATGTGDAPLMQEEHLERHAAPETPECSRSDTAGVEIFRDEEPIAPIKNRRLRGSVATQPRQRFYYAIVGAIISLLESKAGVLIVAVSAGLLLLPLIVLQVSHQPPRPIRVAFIGNSITYVNDLPRLMEAMSQGSITQNSCLHGGARLRTILNTGNGMYSKWQTQNAHIRTITAGDTDDELYDDYLASQQCCDDDDDNATDTYSNESSYELYDFGTCTVPQLLFGYDENLELYNANGNYQDDGKNPCFQDPVYFQYQQARYEQLLEESSNDDDGSNLDLWDYVVMNDQTNGPAIPYERSLAEKVLQYIYEPWLQHIQATPVLIMTHAYSYNASVQFDSDYDETWQDIPTFTSALYHGYRQYANVLSASTKIAPSGLAFLMVWEENPEMWEQLFQVVDGFHPSPHGTFLMACVLYATLYQKMPSLSMLSENGIADMWSRSRRMGMLLSSSSSGEYTTDAMPIPTRDEALYLASIARRVTLKGELPKSLDLSFSDS